jgi:Zn-dependent protease with chaperone function
LIPVTCPGCGKSYRMRLEAAGKRGKCKNCDATIRVPSLPAAGSDSSPILQRVPRSPQRAAKTHEVLQVLDEAVQFPKRPVTFGHRLTALAVAMTMLVLPVIYVLFALGVGWLTWWHITNDYVWVGVRGAGQLKLVALVMYVGLGVGGVVWVFSLIRPLFFRFDKPDRQPGLSRIEEPLIFAFADRLADKVGCPRPDIIRLSLDVNASAYYETSFFGLRRRAFTLTLGLPLIRGMTLAQLAGVMAHEFGHFSQRGSIFLDRLIRRVNLWFVLAVHRRDAIDAVVQTLTEGGGHYLVWLLGFVLFALVGVGRLVLWCLMQIGLLVSASLMQRMEFDADSYEVRVIGSSEFAVTMRRLVALGISQEIAVKYAFGSLQCRILPSDLPAFIAELADRSPQVKKRSKKQIDNEPKIRRSSHPPLRDRIAAAQEMNLPGAFSSPVPGTALFKSFDKNSAALTDFLYRRRYGTAIPHDAIHPTLEAVDAYLELAEANRQFRKTARNSN